MPGQGSGPPAVSSFLGRPLPALLPIVHLPAYIANRNPAPQDQTGFPVMNQTVIFWPMLAQVALIYAVYFLMFVRRKEAIKAGSVKISQFRENRDEPPQSLFVRNNLANQFELPVLFFAVCLAFYVTAGASLATVALAWIFVASRFAHAAIHVTSNRLRYRQPAFTLGFLALLVLWLLFAVHIAGLA
jgi:hypothetical protein